MNTEKRIGVIGLGYVGFPLACLFAKKYQVIGYDINERRINEINAGIDSTNEVTPEALKNASFDAYDVLNIGQDGTGSYGAALSATVDEFMIFDGALTDADLAKLAEYYGK